MNTIDSKKTVQNTELATRPRPGRRLLKVALRAVALTVLRRTLGWIAEWVLS